jgi:hypothetical protein
MSKPISFSFWKDNKISGLFKLTDRELMIQFEMWIKAKGKIWLIHYNITQCVLLFVTEGLLSTGNSDDDFAEFRIMEKILKPIYNDFVK